MPVNASSWAGMAVWDRVRTQTGFVLPLAGAQFLTGLYAVLASSGFPVGTRRMFRIYMYSDGALGTPS